MQECKVTNWPLSSACFVVLLIDKKYKPHYAVCTIWRLKHFCADTTKIKTAMVTHMVLSYSPRAEMSLNNILNKSSPTLDI